MDKDEDNEKDKEKGKDMDKDKTRTRTRESGSLCDWFWFKHFFSSLSSNYSFPILAWPTILAEVWPRRKENMGFVNTNLQLRQSLFLVETCVQLKTNATLPLP